MSESTIFSHTKEFHDLREHFEKVYKGERLDKEEKTNYARGWFYQNGQTNDLFKAFMQGYQLGKISQ